MIRLPALLLCLVLALLPLHRVEARDTPRDAVEAVMQAMRSEGVGALAAHMHPAELERFRALLLPALAPPASAPVAIQQLAHRMRRDFFGNIGADELRQMPAQTVMHGFLDGHERQMREAGMRFGHWEVVGIVAEGEVMHAIVRSQSLTAAGESTLLEVLSLRRDGSQWKLLLSGELEATARMLRMQVPGLE